MHKIHTAYFLDFDHTLFNTDEFFHVDIRNAVLQLGISKKQWETSYEKVRQSGYTFEKHIKELSLLSKKKMPLKNIKHILKNDLKHYLFPDVINFLEYARTKEISLFLISLGNPEWQRYKIIGSQIDVYFKDMFFTSKEGDKVQYILKYTDKYKRIVVVDNNPTELDTIKDKIPMTETYLINRVPENEPSKLKFLSARIYAKKQYHHQHIICKNLDSIR